MGQWNPRRLNFPFYLIVSSDTIQCVLPFEVQKPLQVATEFFTNQSMILLVANVLLPPAYEVSRRLCFQHFCPSVHRMGGGGGVKIEKCSECHGKPKKCIKIFSDYTPFDQVWGGVKIEKCSECHGKPKKCIKIFSDYTPFDQVGGGGGGLLQWKYHKWP